jgi:NAD(P)H-nitrite reductase large subunit
MVADNRIVGMILLGRTGKAGMLRNLLKNRKEISTWKGKLARNALDLRELLPALAGS